MATKLDPLSHPARNAVPAAPAPAAARGEPAPFRVRRLGRVNWRGLRALIVKEVRRFIAVGVQTVAAPMVTTMLYLAIFTLALGRSARTVGDVPFSSFLAPGLIMMAMVQNAFANTSSSIVSAKMQGNIVDVLMAPLSPSELCAGYAVGGLTRGLCVGLGVGLVMLPFVHVSVEHWPLALYHAVAASLLLSLLGIAGGIWAQKHEQMAVVSNFIITPLSFLSGTFYSVTALPQPWQSLAHIDPFFYMIDGFRYAFIGHAEGSLAVGVVVMAVGNVAMWLLCRWMLKTGYRLKA
ncbi:MAG: ABC transporter permease [Gemmatimonas sp.]